VTVELGNRGDLISLLSFISLLERVIEITECITNVTRNLRLADDEKLSHYVLCFAGRSSNKYCIDTTGDLIKT